METIKVTTEAGEFEFRVEERIKDSLLIEQTAVKYAGGYEQLSELKRLTTIFYDEYHSKLKQVLSEEKYLEKISVLTKGSEAADEKQQVIREFLEIASPEYLKFMEVNNMLENVYKIAKATVLQVDKPGVTRLDDLPSEYALSLIEKLEEELIFFRRKKKSTAPVNSVIGDQTVN